SLALLSFLHTSTRLTTTPASTPPSSSPELSLDASLLERAMQIRLQAAFQTGELTFSRLRATRLWRVSWAEVLAQSSSSATTLRLSFVWPQHLLVNPR